MPSGWVIQDSDEEDDALSDVATSIDPLQDQSQRSVLRYGSAEADNREQPHEQELQPLAPAVSGSQLGVNFDDFLQSECQGMAEHGLSSSQQRREERWIPVDSGNGSVGAMMSEIGRAQRRLVDDATPYDNPQLPSTDASADPIQPGSPSPKGLKRSQTMIELDDSRGFDTGYCSGQQAKRSRTLIGYGEEAEPLDLPQDANGETVHELPQGALVPDAPFSNHTVPYVQGDDAIINHDEASGATSYNYFDSSLKSREYTEVSTMPLPSPVEERGEQRDTIRRTPGRSKSMQVALDSPHDTEPFSSLISARIKRAKSDIPIKDISEQSYNNNCDELSLPAAVEAPVVKKKRGRKKKQPTTEEKVDDETDELNPEEAYIVPKEPNKRGRGRPRKDKAQDENPGSPGPDSRDDIVVAIPQHDQSTISAASLDQINNAKELNEESAYDPPGSREMDIGLPKEQYMPRPSRSRAQPIENYESPDPMPNPAKELKKKKIKRGKTTSVIIKKSYESDVEEDVIWIDEKPADVAFKDEKDTPAATKSEPVGIKDFVSGEKNETEEIKPADPVGTVTKQESKPTSIDSAAPQVEEPPPGPKKRGRKRKKTAELAIAEPPLEERQPQDPEPNKPTALLDIPSNIINPPNPVDEQRPTPNHDTTIAESTPNQDALPPTPLETPKKQTPNPQHQPISTPETTTTKGPDKHSPISSTSKIPYRVGLSRRARIAPLLKVVRK